MRRSRLRTYLVAVLTALAFSALFWLLDGVYEYYRFDDNLRFMLFQEPLTLMDAIILNIPQHAIFNRGAFAVAALIGGLGVATYMVRWRESSMRHETYLAAAPTGVFIAGPDGRYLEVNEAACRQTGYDRQELLKMRVGDLLDPDSTERAANHFASVQRSGKASGEFAFLRQDGQKITMIVDAVRLDDGRAMGITTDTTTIHAAREREHHVAQVLRGIRNVNQLITQTEDRQELLQGACDNLTETLSYYSAWMVLFDADGQATMMAQSGIDSDYAALQAEIVTGADLPCVVQSLSQAGVCVVHDPLAACQECPLTLRYAEHASLTMRLAYREHTYGVVTVSVPREYADDKEELDLFRELADDIGFALHKIELSEQRAASEQRLRQYAHIVAASQDGLAMVDCNYTYLVTNQAYAKLTDSLLDDIEGNQVSDIIGQSLFDNMVKPRLDQCLAGEYVLWQRWLTMPSGETHYLQIAYAPVYDDSGQVNAVSVRISDMTNLQQAERELMDRGREMEQIIEAIPDTVIFTDNERRITRINKACTQMTGYAPDELIGKTTRIFYASEQDYQEQGVRRSDKLSEATDARREITYRRKNGETMVGETIGTVVRDAEDRPIGFLALVRDITDRKIAQQERQSIERQMRQAQKMEAVGQLAGGVAHDFNNLLQIIRGYAEFLLEELQPASEEHEFAVEIRQSAERAAALTRQLLAFSRRQVLARSDLDLDDLVQNILKMLGRLIGEHIDLTFSPAHETLWVNADPGQIEQVLMNLCVNARDAMPKGGSLTIETRRASLDQAFCRKHAWAQTGDYAALSVTDTGCGMDEVVLSQLFEPFFTTKGVGKGTGLGLATIYGIIQQHEGLIDVHSKPGEGSTFTIYLPLVKTGDAAAIDQLPEPAPGGSETILLAEDDPIVRRLAVRLLQDAGYNVIVASDGHQAMELLDQHASHVDLVLLDVIMPKASGSEVYQHYRAKYPTGHVLFMSGYSTGVLGDDFLSSPDTAFIAKPFSSEELLRKIREALH